MIFYAVLYQVHKLSHMNMSYKTWAALLIGSALMVNTGCESRPDDTDRTEKSTTNHSPSTDTSMTDTTRNMTTGQGNDASKESTDPAVFIAKHIQGNMAEIAHSKMAQKGATSKDVKNLASSMVQDHTKMLNDLKALAAKKQITAPTEASADAMTQLQAMSKMSGNDFDKMWVSHMLTAHEATLADLQNAASNATDADIKNAANKAIPIVKMHRDLLAKLNQAMAHQ